jgi:membrane-bound inhibitor of C-type lysozyme
MNRSISTSIQLKACALLILVVVMLLVSITGCVSEQPNNETSAATDPVNITYTYCHEYNGTSYLTGVIKNVGTWNLLDISLHAEGYANNTTKERGDAGPQTGVNSTLLPGGRSPFMIEMSKVAPDVNTTPANQTRVISASPKPATATKNITSNLSIAKVGTLATTTCNLRYTIKAPVYMLSKTEPNLLTITNNKTLVSNQTISVSGEVYNGGTKNITSSVVAVAFYRNDGYVLGVFIDRPQGEVGPNKTIPFQIDVPRHFFDSSISSINATRIEEYAYELIS